jgi:hypothetical protein
MSDEVQLKAVYLKHSIYTLIKKKQFFLYNILFI